MMAWVSVLMAAGFLAGAAPVTEQTDTIAVPTFGRVVVYRPASEPAQIVLFVSGDGGWNLGVVAMAERLRDRGALVAGIDIRTFVKSLERSKGCAYPAGDLEKLSRAIQLRYHVRDYKPPILVGYSSGASLVYAALAAAPPESFAGGVSLGFCPELEIMTSPCRMRGLDARRKAKAVGYDLSPFPRLQVPWMVLQGEIDQVCAPAATRAFVARTGSARLFSLPRVGHGFAVPRNWEPQFIEAYRAVADASARHAAPQPSIPGVEDLPLVEVPAGESGARREMAILLTGDGGWAELDKSVAAGLAAAGVPTVGWSSLRYYWTPRTPEAAAADLARIITHYSAAWRIERVLLIGYSFGADVLPFLVNRLDASARAKVAQVTLLGLDTTAAFAFHLAEWVGQSVGQEYPTIPEIARLEVPVTCVQGAGEDSACRLLEKPRVRVVTIGSGHHFGGEYAQLVNVVLQGR